jgi:hypothetical protein
MHELLLFVLKTAYLFSLVQTAILGDLKI